MSWYDRFKEISQVDGDNSREKNFSEAQATFNEYFANSIDRVDDGTINDVNYPFVIQHLKYGENFNDEKLFICENSTPMSTGSFIGFDDKTWLSINEENRAIKTHQVFKIGLCNSQLNKRNLDDNTTFSEKCVFTFAERFESKDKKIRDWKSGRVAIVQSNSNTQSVIINDRFIFSGKRAFKVVDIDDTTTEGIITFYLEASQLNDNDDTNNNIAYNGDADIPVDTDDNGVLFTDENNNVLSEVNALTGFEYDIDVYEYISGVQQANTFTFTIENIDSDKYELSNVTGNSFTIKGLDSTFTGTIKATDTGDLSEHTITLNLKGMF